MDSAPPRSSNRSEHWHALKRRGRFAARRVRSMTRLHDHVVLSFLEPKRVAQGWLIRIAIRNDGRQGAFETSVVDVGRLRGRSGSAEAFSLATGRSDVVRLAVCRDVERDVVLLSASADGTREYRVATPAPVTVTVRVSKGSKTVVEQNVRLGIEERDGALRPVATFTSASSATLTTTAPHTKSERIAEEAQRFGQQNNQTLRGVSWNAIPYFRDQVGELFDMAKYVREHLQGCPHPVALTMACGEMLGEYGFFKRVGVAEIDASDISEGQREKFYERYDGKIPVSYTIGDANEIQLEPERYDLVYVQHAYHHIEALEHVAEQIAKSLKPDGIFAINDYVGANFLQRTSRQRDLCGAIWRSMPERYRIGMNGCVVEDLHIPSKASLPPYEAVRAEDILDVLHAHFEFQEYVAFGGILMPLFNGFVHCYTDAPEDDEFLRVMWDLDQWLINAGAVEPNFMKAILVRSSQEKGTDING